MMGPRKAAAALLVLLGAGTSPLAAQGFVYAANAASNTISGYSIDPVTGALTPLAGLPGPAAAGIRGTALHPSGRFLYDAVDQVAAIARAWRVDAVSGALTPIGSVTVGIGPTDVVLDPAGAFAYVMNFGSFNVSAFRVDATTGALTAVPGSPFATPNPALTGGTDPSGRFLYVVNGNTLSAFTINRSSGALTPVAGSPFAVGTLPRSVVVEPSGRFLYVPNQTSNNVSAFAIDGASGVLTPLAGSPFAGAGGPFGSTVHPNGRFLYVTRFTGTGVSGFAIDSQTGALTTLPGSPYAGAFTAARVVVDVGGRFAYVTNRDPGTVSAYTIDQASGALTPGAAVAAGTSPIEITTGRNFTRGDFDANGRTDILWRHETSGENVSWLMNGTVLASGTFTTPATLPDVRWKMVGTHDFDRDRESDILWRHEASGENVLWFMNGTVLAAGTFLSPAALADVDWKMAGTGDFNLDGRPDIAWHHRVSGQIVLWYMNGSTLVSGTFTTPAALTDTAWRLVGVADFNSDHHPDLLWRHQLSGQIVVWLMDNASLVSGTFTTPAALADTDWQISAVGDYNADYRPDLVWRHATSGQNVVWLMDGVTLMSGTFTTPPALPDTGWRIVGPR